MILCKFYRGGHDSRAEILSRWVRDDLTRSIAYSYEKQDEGNVPPAESRSGAPHHRGVS